MKVLWLTQSTIMTLNDLVNQGALFVPEYNRDVPAHFQEGGSPVQSSFRRQDLKSCATALSILQHPIHQCPSPLYQWVGIQRDGQWLAIFHPIFISKCVPGRYFQDSYTYRGCPIARRLANPYNTPQIF
jgi:hypothetical protein